MKELNIYTDGSCSPNPGRGGYSFIILEDEQCIFKYTSKSYPQTTNNRMELIAFIVALRWVNSQYIPKKGQVLNSINIYSDSNYIIEGYTTWWKRWVYKDFKNVKNDDLWRKLRVIRLKLHIKDITIIARHVKGHSTNKWNNFVDQLANEARLNQ